jgi:hypothetical protein
MSIEGFAREIANTEGDVSDIHVMIEVGHAPDDQDCNNNKRCEFFFTVFYVYHIDTVLILKYLQI